MKVLLWELFEIGINVFQGFMAVYFTHSYLGNIKSKKFINTYNLIFVGIFATMVTILNKLMLFEGHYAFIYVILLFLHSMIYHNGTILRKLFASIYPMVLMLVSTVVTSSFMIALLGSDQSEMSQGISTDRFFIMVIIQLIIFYTTSVSLKILKKEQFTLTPIEWILISVIFVISISISALLNSISLNGLTSSEKRSMAIIFIGIVIINIVTFYCLIELGRKNKASHENEILKLKEEHSKSFIESAEREYQTLRELSYDSKENYSILHDYIKNGKNQDALDYIEKIYGDFSAKEIFVNTKNQTFDAIGNSKFTVAKSFGIECTCIASSGFEGIDEYDMVRLLSNMIENAITASKSAEAPKIELSVKEEDSKIIFLLKNKIDKSVLSDNPNLKTTKKDSKHHGLGKGIIKNIASKYNGRCDFYEDSGFFCCFVILTTE